MEKTNINFTVDTFTEMVINDLVQQSDDMRIKINRNLTSDFSEWIHKKITNKEQIKINIKGETRSGKSLVGLRIAQLITKEYPDKIFDTNKIICANQKELRQKLNVAEFGDVFVIDEHQFAMVGAGSISELQQLKDINNIIAKMNIHMIYITPNTFLPTGANIGLSYYGRDTKNWLSRFLVYSMTGSNFVLLGYAIFDISPLFEDTGCFIYNITGGCTNPNKTKINDFDREVLKKSFCIIDKKKQSENKNSCPFYNNCNSQMCNYEHIKDKWIEREMRGGLGEREQERLEVALQIFIEMIKWDSEKSKYVLDAKNLKEIKLKVKIMLSSINNTKYTGVEIDEIATLVLTMLDFDFLKSICDKLEINFDDKLKEITSKQ